MRLRHTFIAPVVFALVLAPAAASSQSEPSYKSWRLGCTLYGGADGGQDVFVQNLGTRAVPGGTTIRWKAGEAQGEYRFTWPLQERTGKVVAHLPAGSRAQSCTAG